MNISKELLHTLFESFKLEKGKERIYGGKTNKCLFCTSFLLNDKKHYIIKNGFNNNSFYVNGKIYNNYTITDETPYEFGYIQFNCNVNDIDIPDNINDLRSNIDIVKCEPINNIRTQSPEIMETVKQYMESHPSDKDEYTFKFKVPSLIKDTSTIENISRSNSNSVNINESKSSSSMALNSSNTIFNSLYNNGYIYTNSFPKRVDELLESLNNMKIDHIKIKNNELVQNTLLEFKYKISMALSSKTTTSDCAVEVNKLIESIDNSLKSTK